MDTRISFIEDLLQFSDSLYRGMFRKSGTEISPHISHRARQLLRKHLEVLKETEKLGRRDPSLARAIAKNEAELHWAINRIEDALLISD